MGKDPDAHYKMGIFTLETLYTMGVNTCHLPPHTSNNTRFPLQVGMSDTHHIP